MALAVSAAKEALAAGDRARAMELLKPLATEPNAVEARVLLAEVTFPQAPDQVLALVQDVDSGSPFHERATGLRALVRLGTLLGDGHAEDDRVLHR